MKVTGRDKFEKWARAMGMKPFILIDDGDYVILVADSGTSIEFPEDGEYRDGEFHRAPGAKDVRMYRSGWALEIEGKVQFGRTLEYSLSAFPLYSMNAAQQLRVNDAISDARKHAALWDEIKEEVRVH